MPYRKGRKCKCGTPISIYNPYHLCWKCVKVFCEKKSLPYALFENKYKKDKLEWRPSKTQIKAQEVLSEAQICSP